ncbi:MAG: hypothetical protein JSW26_07495 [Desulfobacterales bacterium]|nr:MAG: hypothetical protein JSW26_07495 [Desulfobacterales bacterium]
MKSITIHNIDEPLAELIKSKARSEGLSINKTVKKLLEESLGVKPREKATNLSDFEEFCGIWSDSELAEFEDATNDLRKVNHEDWK